MSFARRVLHYGPGPDDLLGEISERAIAGCWFELHRRGGCGAGELILRDAFAQRAEIEIGDWIALEFSAGERWYQGRVEERVATSPVRVRLRLEGMGVQLGEVFPGGFGRSVADGTPPHRYARSDVFSYDPDYADETADSVNEPEDVVRLLLMQYVVPRTNITYDSSLIENGPAAGELRSLKFRGEESVRGILKELALRSRDASWGVRPDGKFYFLQQRAGVQAVYQEGVQLLKLQESCDREHLFNRIVLTGDYVYNAPPNSSETEPAFYRWRGNYLQPESRATYGDRRLRMWVPWIRTATDARQFTREFFRIYSQPTRRYLIEVAGETALPLPWLGRIQLLDLAGNELVTSHCETIRVEFDHTPHFRMELGPDDPRTHWPEPPQDERWEVAGQSRRPGYGGSEIRWNASESGSDSGSSFDSDTSSLSSNSNSISSSAGCESSDSESVSSGSHSGTLSHSGSSTSAVTGLSTGTMSGTSSGGSGTASISSTAPVSSSGNSGTGNSSGMGTSLSGGFSSSQSFSGSLSSSGSSGGSSGLSGSSSSSAASTSGNVVSVPCCPSGIATTLYADVIDTASGFRQTLTLDYDPGSATWRGGYSNWHCNTSQISLKLQLQCVSGQWLLQVLGVGGGGCGSGNSSAWADQVTCSPLALHFAVPTYPPFCCGVTGLTATITD